MKVAFAAALLAALYVPEAFSEESMKGPRPMCVPLEERVIYYQIDELVCRAVLPASQALAIIRIPSVNAQVFILGTQATLSRNGEVVSSGILRAKVSCSEGPFHVEWDKAPYMGAYGGMLAHNEQRSAECRYTHRTLRTPP